MFIRKAVITLFLLTPILVACDPGGDTQGLKDTLTVNALNIENIYLEFQYAETLNSDSTYLGINETEQVIAKANDEKGTNINENVTWSTSNSAIAQINQNGLPLLSLGLLMGETTTDKVQNVARNLLENRLSVIQCICIK